MLAIAFLLLFGFQLVAGLWPIPRSLQSGKTLVKLGTTFDIQVQATNPPSDLLDAIDRTKSHIHNDKLQRLIVGRGANNMSELAKAPSLSRLVLSIRAGHAIRSISEEAIQPISSRSEGYSLTVPSDGSSAVLTADSTLGLLRGLTTFEQLWYDLDGTTYAYETPIKIDNDAPAYPYRGLMLDTARNFFGVQDIKRTLDAMSLVKMNTFHWHIVDSQSFPLDIAEFPEIARQGAYSSAETYKTTDIQDIVSYAGARGIDVLMEIDTPGHTAIIAESHPEHMTCNTPATQFSGEPPTGQLRFSSPATTNFTASLLSSIAKTLPSQFFSTGGDEVNTACYTHDAQTQADLKSSGRTLEQALSVFVQATHTAIAGLGKSPVVWEEMVLEHQISLRNDTVVMVWISSQHAASVAAKNFRIVHAPSDYFYLDCGGGEWLGNSPNSNSWCDPFKTWQKAYTFDPLANLTTAQAKLVLGGQQLLWTEQSSPENLDPIVWPRAASSAEVFWTGPVLPDGNPRNLTFALPRMHDIRYRMVQRGVRAIALQPQWCALRPGNCNA
ncbi:N-acetylhexosaminidase [Infundibulicybe gibba]|nr:N-acetylhexosaminidase [Infundibulicybe gibba]